MHHFRLPSPVQIRDFEGKAVEEWAFLKFFREGFAADPKFGKTAEDVRSYCRISTAVEKTTAGEVVTLDTEDWKRLKDVMETPTAPYKPWLVAQILPFIDAVANATTDLDKA